MPKLRVVFFQRKPRPSGNFSIEAVFDTVRIALRGEIDAQICEAPFHSNGIIRRFANIWHARSRQGQINHVTGDISYVTLLLEKKRTILTSHDCGFLERPAGLKRWLLRKFWVELPVKYSAAVTAISAFAKEEIIRHTGCDPEKVHIIPNPVPRGFQRSPYTFNSERPRILHIGIAPNKNLPRLIEAIQGLNCVLVIVGELDRHTTLQLAENQIEYENYINLSSADLVRQYELCDIVAFVSLYEGFGLPIIEAQAVGRPVITSARPPMLDVAGPAACFVDPEDIRSIRNGILKLIADSSYRHGLVDAGFQNVRCYTPDRIAQQYLGIYRQVFDAAPGRLRQNVCRKTAVNGREP